MAYEHKYFGKTTSNRFVIKIDHFIRKLFSNNLDESSDNHINPGYLFTDGIGSTSLRTYNNTQLGTEVNSHQAMRIETAKFLQSGLR